MPEIGLRNFLWASDFPGLDSPWPDSKAMGHAPAEAALGKEALNQLVFENAVSLYKIPVTLARVGLYADKARDPPGLRRTARGHRTAARCVTAARVRGR